MSDTIPKSPVSDPAEEPHRAVGRLIKLTLNSLVRAVDQRVQPLGLTAMQWQPLLMLSKGVDTVAMLAREVEVNCGAMTRMLDRLEEKQLVRRRRNATDRRVVHLELTERGRTVVEEMMPIVNDELQRHLRGFTAQETATLIRYLERIVQNGAQQDQMP